MLTSWQVFYSSRKWDCFKKFLAFQHSLQRHRILWGKKSPKRWEDALGWKKNMPSLDLGSRRISMSRLWAKWCVAEKVPSPYLVFSCLDFTTNHLKCLWVYHQTCQVLKSIDPMNPFNLVSYISGSDSIKNKLSS